MKRFAYFRWSPHAILAVLALSLIPAPVHSQTREVRERQEEALRRLEERLARIQEDLGRAGETDLEAQARFERALTEIREVQAGRLEEAQERARMVAEEQAARAQILAEMTQERQAEVLAQARERGEEVQARLESLRQEQRLRLERLEQERRVRSEDARRMARELAVRVRNRTEGERARMAERIRDAQQVVVRVRARARLGVGLNGTQGDEYDRQGARVTDVVEDSPADQAGLQEGDIITHLDGHSLLSPIPGEDELEFGEDTSLPVQRLMALARDLEDGQEVEVRYLRDGEARSVTMEVAELGDRWVTVVPRDLEGGIYRLGPEGRLRWRYNLPDQDFDLRVEPWTGSWKGFRDLDIEIPEIHFDEFQLDSLKGFNIWRGEGPNALFFRRGEAPNALFYRGGGDDFTFEFLGRGRIHGIELRELNAGLGEYFSIERGVLVLDVAEESTLGLRPGDVILSVGDRSVEDTRDVYRILGSYEKEEAVTFTVMRHGQEVRVEGTIE
jgi:C-terminal processing protease CtpA/Prc